VSAFERISGIVSYRIVSYRIVSYLYGQCSYIVNNQCEQRLNLSARDFYGSARHCMPMCERHVGLPDIGLLWMRRPHIARTRWWHMVHDSTVNTNNKTVVDCKTRPGAAIWGVSAATLCANVTSSIKPEVHNLLQRHQRRTGPRSQVTFTTRCKAKPDCSPPGYLPRRLLIKYC